MCRHVRHFVLCLLLVNACGAVSSAGEPANRAESLKVLKNLGAEGKGHPDAIVAWKTVSQGDAETLPEIFAAFDDANPLVLNWLRGAVEAIVDRELSLGKKLPVAALETFLLDRRHHPQARRFVFELLVKNDPSARERFVPKMLNDPSVELRHDAVQQLIDRGSAASSRKETDEAKRLYREAMSYARDTEQVELLVKRLQQLGEGVDLPRHFGFLMKWKVVGPFENSGRKGFATAFPPEEKVDFAASYKGKAGQSVNWKEFTTTDDYGVVDLNKVVEHAKEVTAFAAAEFINSQSTLRTVDFRLGTGNAWKVWLNGQLLFAREEYHRGKRVDQYRLRAELKPGKNVILLKVCQDQEKYAWTDDWQFQFRVCDESGTAILSADVAAKPNESRSEKSLTEGAR